MLIEGFMQPSDYASIEFLSLLRHVEITSGKLVGANLPKANTYYVCILSLNAEFDLICSTFRKQSFR